MQDAAAEYADALGMAFQIRDDMLDVIGDVAAFGKPIGSDKEEQKTTFVDLFGIDGCAKKVQEYTQRAKAALGTVQWPGDTAFLKTLADSLQNRNV